MSRLIIACVIGLAFTSCSDDTNEYFRIKSDKETGLDFENTLNTSHDLNILNYMYFYNGGGLALADLNNDGLQDIVFSSNLEEEKTYLNTGNLQFEDVSSQTGIDGGQNSWTNGVAVADVNGDGLLDVYLSQVGSHRILDCTNKLFICTRIGDDGIPRYKEQAEKYGLDFKGFSTQAGFFDYDLDGDLDMFLLNHSLHNSGTFGTRPTFQNKYDSLSGDRLFRNDGSYFTDVTRTSGINSSVVGYGLGIAFSDINLDGWPDIYIGNDFHENDYLYINQKDGTFKDELDTYIMHTSRFSMGVDIADVNGDIYPDILSLDMLPEDSEILMSSEGENDLDVFRFKLGYGYNFQYAKNALQLNTGNGVFSEVAMLADVHATDWSWSSLIFDMDMDGLNDIFISNGLPKRTNDIDYIDFISNSDVFYKIQFDQLTEKDLEIIDKAPEIKINNKFHLNQGNLSFLDISKQVGNNKVSYSNSAVYADLDNDGDYDIICNNINDKAFLYENITEVSGVRVDLSGPQNNRHAIGSKLIIYHSDGVQMLENFTTHGFQGSSLNSFMVSPLFEQDSTLLVWPDKSYQNLGNTRSDTLVKYSAGLPVFNFDRLSFNADYSIEEISELHGLEYTHEENPFVEFNREALIPHSCSTDGPALTIADFNNDNLEDIFIGSAKRRWNSIFVQDSKGHFIDMGDIGIDSTYEDVDALAGDFNGNGLTDLVIATGGNEFAYTSNYTSQLIIFDVLDEGKRIEELPLNMTASCVEAADFDDDGDLDLFFGARAQVSSYGAEVVSSILINEGNGNFEIYPDDFIPELKTIGMVKDALWVDYDKDGDEDLILAEEWGGIHLFLNGKAKFSHKVLVSDKGWWNTIALEDLDNDGDLDIFAGNIGLNSRFKASQDYPVRMYYNDFDDNGKKEQILTYYLDGREIPFNNFKEIKAQIPTIKKKYLYANDFAKADIKGLFGIDKIDASRIYEMNFMESVVYENLGNDAFSAHPLPRDMQISSIQNVLFEDFNEDGLLDIFVTGNYYDCNIQMGRYDADFGTLAINKGQCTFEKMKTDGHNIRNQVRRTGKVTLANDGEAIVLAKNDDRLEMIKIKSKR